MRVTLLNFTPDPEKTVMLAARLCYSAVDIAGLARKVNKADAEKFLGRILRMGHYSVLEHASFTFGIEGVSRALTHQLVRHRLASYSQQSQRYVTFDSVEYVTPGSIGNDPDKKKRYDAFLRRVSKLYREFVDQGVPAEDARYVLPNAACSRIIVTMNARELIHFYRLRCCERAQWEIRAMATAMLKLSKEKARFIFKDSGPACVKGACSEGDMTCGMPREIRERFRAL